MREYKFHVLGCRGSHPSSGIQFKEFGGATSCYIIKSESHAIVLDCGTGLYGAKSYLDGCTQIDILLTHWHYDHIIGLLDCSVFPPEAEVRIYTAVEKNSERYSLADIFKGPFWPITPNIGETIRIDRNQRVQLNENSFAQFYPSNHQGNATIIRVETDNGAMCLACDWEHGKPFPMYMAQDCSFLIYDGMFTDDEYLEKKGWGHSTWREGVKLASELDIPRLMITHHAPFRIDEELLEIESEAKAAFPSIHFCRVGDSYSMGKE